MDKVKSGSCKEEVFYFTQREVKDLSLDIPLKKACGDDLSSFCRGEEDHSRALLCLRKHRDELAPACKEEELRFSEMEVRRGGEVVTAWQCSCLMQERGGGGGNFVVTTKCGSMFACLMAMHPVSLVHGYASSHVHLLCVSPVLPVPLSSLSSCPPCPLFLPVLSSAGL